MFRRRHDCRAPISPVIGHYQSAVIGLDESLHVHRIRPVYPSAWMVRALELSSDCTLAPAFSEQEVFFFRDSALAVAQGTLQRDSPVIGIEVPNDVQRLEFHLEVLTEFQGITLYHFGRISCGKRVSHAVMVHYASPRLSRAPAGSRCPLLGRPLSAVLDSDYLVPRGFILASFVERHRSCRKSTHDRPVLRRDFIFLPCLHAHTHAIPEQRPKIV